MLTSEVSLILAYSRIASDMLGAIQTTVHAVVFLFKKYGDEGG
jgi:hypothetical protein